MRSADLVWRTCGAGAAMLLTIALAGCVSTQTKNARTVLVNERTIDTESPVVVRSQNPTVTVSSVQVISGAGGAAVVVGLHNDNRHPVSDLPISVGITARSGTPVYLNQAANQSYFANHLAAIAGGASSIWVLTLSRAPKTKGHLFARVGFAKTPPSTDDTSIPRLSVTPGSTVATSGLLGVSVSNLSGVPQYSLPVYAVATKDGRAVAAASGLIGQLNGGSRTRLALKLYGNATGATLQLAAPATIFN